VVAEQRYRGGVGAIEDNDLGVGSGGTQLSAFGGRGDKEGLTAGGHQRGRDHCGAKAIGVGLNRNANFGSRGLGLYVAIIMGDRVQVYDENRTGAGGDFSVVQTQPSVPVLGDPTIIGPIGKLCVFANKLQFHGSDRAMALFSDDDFCSGARPL
jgi:hypothetical protein